MFRDATRLSCSVIVLAGGKASRMGGVDKPLVEVSGRQLIRRVLDVVEPVFDEIIIACGCSEQYCNIPGTRTVFDEVEGQGPLGGLHAGLGVCSNEWAFVVAGDMPFLNLELILKIVDRAEATEASMVIPRHGEFIEPLHAMYRRSLLGDIERCLATHRRKVAALYEHSIPDWFDIEGEDNRVFYNINSHDDLARAEHSFRDRRR